MYVVREKAIVSWILGIVASAVFTIAIVSDQMNMVESLTSILASLALFMVGLYLMFSE